jgi:hypothetical protein
MGTNRHNARCSWCRAADYKVFSTCSLKVSISFTWFFQGDRPLESSICPQSIANFWDEFEHETGGFMFKFIRY